MLSRNRFTADVVTFPRDVFINEVWDYHPGDCVTVLCPYGGGKTQLMFELLKPTATKELPATIMVMKPKDVTVSKFTKAAKYRTVRDWPPSRVRNFVDKPAGWVLWPKETNDPDRDDDIHQEIFRKFLRERYRAGTNIVCADETYSLENEMGLTKDLRRIWTKGRSNECGLWAASQRPVYISKWAYQAQHLFLGFDPDKTAQKRFADIGAGIDPEAVQYVVSRLQQYEFAYFNREEKAMCVVTG